MVKVKFCGVTTLADAEEAVSLGAWAVGLVHHEQSPRYCAPERAARIGAALKRRCEVAGVFVNPTLDQVVEAAENASMTLLQLHGDEGPQFCAEVARRTGCRVVKAFQVRSSAEVQAAEAFRTAYHLFDAHHPALRGGTGTSFDWGILRRRRSEVPMLLSGGLDAGNVAEAISVAAPFAVDVSSGVEVEPGVKDRARMAEFAAAVGGAGVRA